MEEVGTCLEVGDGIARIYGLQNCMAGEMLDFGNEIYGMALNLEENNIGAVILGEFSHIKEGDQVRRTGRVLEVPGGQGTDRPGGQPAGPAAGRARARSRPTAPARSSSAPPAWSTASR